MSDSRTSVLFISANPSDTERLRLEHEAKRIREELGRRRPEGKGARVTLEVIGATTPNDLRRGLEDLEPEILHFSGHATHYRGVYLEDEVGKALPLSPQLLERLCKHFSYCLKCVVLNACYTSQHAASIIRHVDHVIGMQTAIPDEVAIEFSAAFYDAVAAGKQIPDAYDLACWSIEANYPDSLTTLHGKVQQRFTRNLIPELLPNHQIPVLIERADLTEMEAGSTAHAADYAPRPILWLNIPTLRDLASRASSATLLRAQGRLPSRRVEKQSLIPVSRSDTAPDFSAFLLSDRKILSIIADSGFGKSTLMLQLASPAIRQDHSESSEDRYISFYYDAQQMATVGSLAARLARDLRSSPEDLGASFDLIAAALEPGSLHFVVFVDGINECVQPSPLSLRAEIEDLAARSPANIKFVYACRRVFWDTYIEPREDVPPRLYYGGGVYALGAFSTSEARAAFQQYQTLFDLRGRFEELQPLFRDRLRNPLMLRLIAEAYQGRDLPAFAPAVLVFKAYEESLRQRFRTTGVMEFLDELMSLKREEGLSSKFATEIFTRKEAMQLDTYKAASDNATLVGRNMAEPLTALYDEGVIFFYGDLDDRFRFVYDRFFEYLLGKKMLSNSFAETQEPVAQLLEGEIERWGSRHICYWQALKSEIIRRNLVEPGGRWDLTNPNLTRKLVHSDPVVSEFTRDVLRELIFEGGIEVGHVLDLEEHRERGLLLALDVAGDHGDVVPILVDALFSGDRELRVRATSCLAKLNRDPSNRNRCRSEVRQTIIGRSALDQALVTGLVYLSAAEFSVVQGAGQQQEGWLGIWEDLFKHEGLSLASGLKFASAALLEAVNAEGELFFGKGFTPDGVFYPWRAMGGEEKDAARHLTMLLEKDKDLSAKDLEIIEFFASGKRHWADRDKERQALHVYQLEYRIAEYLLVRRSSRKGFAAVEDLLASLCREGDWFLSDFALVVTRDILRFVLGNEPAQHRSIFETMVKWDREYEARSPEYYRALDDVDPFLVNSIPLYLTAVVDAEFFTTRNEPVSVLQREFESNETRRILLALLAARLLGRKGRHGLDSLLRSMRPVLNHHNELVRAWVDRVLRELHLVHPRLIDIYLTEERFPRPRAAGIRHRYASRDVEGVAHNGEALYRFLFLGPAERLTSVRYWHHRLLESPSSEAFVEELVDALLRQAVFASKEEEPRF